MCTLLPSRLYVSREVFSSIRVALQSQRSSIHFWHHIRQKTPLGQIVLLRYESLTVPDITSQSIRLWSDRKYLGLVPVKDVLRNHLSPGYMLSLRGDPPSKSKPPPPSGYDYEVRPLKIDRPQGSSHSRMKGLRAREYYLDASVSPGRLQNQLLEAYKFLDRSSRAKNTRTPPVEFHLRAKGPLRQADLSLFTKDRVDLHPDVILRALPEGVFQALQPKGDLRDGDALWIVGTKNLGARPYAMPRGPSAMASKVEKMVDNKRKQLEELIASGKMTPEGEMAQGWWYQLGETLIGDAPEEKKRTEMPDQPGERPDAS